MLLLFILRGESINVGSLFVITFLNFTRFTIAERHWFLASNNLNIITVHSEGVNLFMLVHCLFFFSLCVIVLYFVLVLLYISVYFIFSS